MTISVLGTETEMEYYYVMVHSIWLLLYHRFLKKIISMLYLSIYLSKHYLGSLA